MNEYTEWTVMGEGDGEKWIATLTEYTREEAAEYKRRHGGYLVCRTVTDWTRP